ncbi:hypothetical protein J3E73DRAFT_285174, partial [Bipolaris maydis]
LLHNLIQADADTASKKQVQEEEANHAHDIEVKANVKDNVDEENIVPTSATIRGQGSEDAPLNAGAKSKSSHQQDSLGDQHSDGVADNLGQKQDLQSKLNGDFKNPPSHEDKDSILVL